MWAAAAAWSGIRISHHRDRRHMGLPAYGQAPVPYRSFSNPIPEAVMHKILLAFALPYLVLAGATQAAVPAMSPVSSLSAEADGNQSTWSQDRTIWAQACGLEGDSCANTPCCGDLICEKTCVKQGKNKPGKTGGKK